MPTAQRTKDYHGIENDVGDGVLDVPHDIHQIIRMIIQLRKSMENDIIIYGGKYEKNI